MEVESSDEAILQYYYFSICHVNTVDGNYDDHQEESLRSKGINGGKMREYIELGREWVMEDVSENAVV